MLRVATANVNGIRAADRRGVRSWLAGRRPEVLCLQEVRADDDTLCGVIGPGWHGVHEESSAKGRAGVAVLSRVAPQAVRPGLGGFVSSGRWVEADYALAGGGLLTVVSAYVHKGEAGTARQEDKYRFLGTVRERLGKLATDGRHVLVCGDLNIAHREVDLKNWKGNRDRAGFLPRERSWLDGLLGEDGFVDVHRLLAGEGPGPYTWWSWRGKAFDNDAGWRIDYQIATAELASLARTAEVGRAPTYAERWSDHAPVVVEYDVALRPRISQVEERLEDPPHGEESDLVNAAEPVVATSDSDAAEAFGLDVADDLQPVAGGGLDLDPPGVGTPGTGERAHHA